MEFIYEWVKNIVVYLILITVVMNLLGKSSYKKYIGIFTGMILVLLILSPIMKLFKFENTFNNYFDKNNFIVEAEDITDKLFDAESEQKNNIMIQYKEKIKEQIKQIVEKEDMYFIKAEITIEEKKEEENYGRIKSIEVVVSYYDKIMNEESKIKSTKKIIIDKIIIKDKQEEQNNANSNNSESTVLSIAEIELKKSIGDFYNIPKNNINIIIQE